MEGLLLMLRNAFEGPACKEVHVAVPRTPRAPGGGFERVNHGPLLFAERILGEASMKAQDAVIQDE